MHAPHYTTSSWVGIVVNEVGRYPAMQLCIFCFSWYGITGAPEKNKLKLKKKKQNAFAWLRAQTLENTDWKHSAAFEPKRNIQMPREH